MSAHASHALLAERIASIPSAVRVACAAALPDLARLAAADRIIVTGGGLSEGPARVLVARLQRAGRAACFVAQSEFARDEEREPNAALVLFSQGLAPNARLPLGIGLEPRALPRRLGPVLLVGSVAPGPTGVASIARRLVDAGHGVWTLPPASEDRLLLRVVGPAVALVAALRIADAISAAPPAPLDALPALVAHRLEAPGLELFGASRRTIALVAETGLAELAMPLRWKLLEGLRVPDPPVWDPLQVVHGPLQAYYDEPLTLLALRLDDDGLDDVYARLRAVLRPDRHALLELRAVAPLPLALVELDAALDACLLTTLAAHPLALDDWPSRGMDGPMYDLDPDLLSERPR